MLRLVTPMFFLLFLAGKPAQIHAQETLLVRIGGLESNQGLIQVALYDQPDGFPKEKGFLKVKSSPVSAVANGQPLEIPNVGFGAYALAVYHDVNGNGELDTNTFGVPTEPYAFSNNPRIKWRGPKFEDARFDFSRNRQVVEVTVKRWKQY